MSTVKLVRQSETKECGLAALAMVGNYHGLRVDLSWMRDKYGSVNESLSLKDLIDIGKDLQFDCRALFVKVSALTELQLPAVLHWRSNHYVVLESVSSDFVTIVDPAIGKKHVTLDELALLYAGVALEMWPNVDFRTFNRTDNRHRRLIVEILLEHWQGLLLLMLVGSLVHIAVLLGPLYLQFAVDRHINLSSPYSLSVLVLVFGALIVIKHLLFAAHSLTSLVVEHSVGKQLSGAVYRRLLQLPVEYHRNRTEARISEIYSSTVFVRRKLVEGLLFFPLDLFVLILLCLIMVVYQPLLAVAAIAARIFVEVVSRHKLLSFAELNDQSGFQRTSLQKRFGSTLRNITDIKLNGAAEYYSDLWNKKQAELLKTNALIFKKKLWRTILRKGTRDLSSIVFIFAALLLVEKSQFSIGMLLAFLAYNELFNQRTDKIVASWNSIDEFRSQLSSLADVFSTKQEDTQALRELEVVGKGVSMSLKQADYYFDSKIEKVLNGFDLFVPANYIVAIDSDDIKLTSNLHKVVLGILSLESGWVEIEGVRLSEISLYSYRQTVAAVHDECQLVEGTVTDNIAYGQPQQDRDGIARAASTAMLDDSIAAMANGYETRLTESSTLLGEKEHWQLYLARALYREPKLLLIDDFDKHLDFKAQAQLVASLRLLATTCIITGSSMSHLSDVDELYHVREGRSCVIDVARKNYRKSV